MPAFHHITHPHPFRPSADLSRFWVVLVISNPVRYDRRYEIFWNAYEMCLAADVNVIVVESQIGHRPFMVTEAGKRTHLQVRAYDEFWEKENLQNMGIRLATELGAEYVAWPDADVRPAGPYREWFEEAWHFLQIYKFVQMFSTACYLNHRYGYSGEPIPGVAANIINHGVPNPGLPAGKSEYGLLRGRPWGNPGLAWAARIESLHAVGGLIDFSIQGAADTQMALSLMGTAALCLNDAIRACAPSYARRILQWQTRCTRWIKRDVGIMPHMVLHDEHGPITQRGYDVRHDILADCRYDPDADIKYGTDGRLRLEIEEERQIVLRDRLRIYFRSRDEDVPSSVRRG